MKPLCNKIWGLNVLAKVKNFVWRACQNSLPTKTNLMKRKVVPDGLCDICKLQQEDTAHAMFHCSKLDSLWNLTPTWNHSLLKQSASFIDLLGFVFTKDMNPELFILMICAVWNRRNNLRLGKPMVPLNQLL